MTKEQYHDYCTTTPNYPLFLQDWWMDAVCGPENWRVIGDMPCYVFRRLRQESVLMPPFTPYGGYYASETSYQQSLDQARFIDRELEAAHILYYFQQFPAASPIPDMLRGLGYVVSEHNTFRLYKLQETDAIRENLSDNKKHQLEKTASMKRCTPSVEEYLSFVQNCNKAQGAELPFNREQFLRMDQAAAEHNAREIVGIQDTNGRLVAATYLVYDAHICYLLIHPYYPSNMRESGIATRVIWESILAAGQHSQIFDFGDLSTQPNLTLSYAQYNASPTTFRIVENWFNPLLFPFRNLFLPA